MVVLVSERPCGQEDGWIDELIRDKQEATVHKHRTLYWVAKKWRSKEENDDWRREVGASGKRVMSPFLC